MSHKIAKGAMDDDGSDGWGRPRPKFSDLLPSTPEQSDDEEDAREMVDRMDTGDERLRLSSNALAADTERVAPLIDYPLPRQDGAPIGELNQSYRNKGLTTAQISGLKLGYYTSWNDGKKSPDMRFTCIFTCPLTGEHFASGNWESEKGKFAEVVDEVCWYTTKKVAMIAAAARALDCFSLRHCHMKEKEPFQRCADSPYLTASDAPKLPDLPPGVALQRGGDEAHVALSVAHPPKQVLNKWYIDFAKKLDVIGIVIDGSINEMDPGKECYASFSNRKGSPHTLWTALFTCHLSGERFPSGTLIGKEGAWEEDYWYFDPRSCILIPRETIEGNYVNSGLLQKIYCASYKTKKEAIDAAAGRAIDCMRHRDSCVFDKYCRELPYTTEETPEIWKAVSESVSGVGDAEWSSLPYEYLLTTRLGVANLHGLLDQNHDLDYWCARYKERRLALGEDM